MSGRLVCDVKISARELIRARSYDLETLCQQVYCFVLKNNFFCFIFKAFVLGITLVWSSSGFKFRRCKEDVLVVSQFIRDGSNYYARCSKHSEIDVRIECSTFSFANHLHRR